MLASHKLNIKQALPTILGIDGALAKSGICVIKNINGENFAFTGVLLPNKLNSERLLHIKDYMSELVEEHKPEFSAIEGYAQGAIGRTFSIAEAGGVFRLVLVDNNIPTVEIPPTTLKKYTTGNGFAKKPLMIKTLLNMYGLKFKTGDEADAFALAIAGLDYFNCDVVELDSFRDYLQSTCVLLNGCHPNTLEQWDNLKRSVRKDQLKVINNKKKEEKDV
jgi:Holliday junction resolvasome RuvABC endonuclease subunit